MASNSSRTRSRVLAAAIACAFVLPAHARDDQAAYDRFIVRFKDGTTEHGNADARQRALDDAGKSNGLHIGQVRRLAIGADLVDTHRKLDRKGAEAFMARLRANPKVAYVQIDSRKRIALTPNDPSYPQQWNYSSSTAGIRANLAWDTTHGAGTVIAVLDTGITAHPDLDANVLPGYDFISDAAVANDGGGRDSNASDPGDWTANDECAPGELATDSSWHGTHVAGTAAAVTNNAVGVAGVAFDAKIVPVRVLGKCGGSTSDIADAMVWASGGTVSGVPANPNPAEVINLSLGGSGGCDAASQEAIDSAVSRGTVVVVAAGNESEDAGDHSPASCNNVITVGATTSAGAKASFSNYGPLVDVSAPGGGGGSSILSTINTGASGPLAPGYAGYQGTSMSTPHIAGIVALMQAVSPKSPAMVETIIKGSAKALVTACSQGCGDGIADAPDALHSVTTPFLYIIDPAMVVEGDTGTATATFTVKLSQAMAGPVTFDIATADGTATVAGGDYVAKTATAQTIAAGQTSKTFAVTVNGDTTVESRESFKVNVTNVSGIEAIDTEGTAWFIDNDGPVLQDDVPITGLSAIKNAKTLYRMEVPPGATNLVFHTTGQSTQDADLYVRYAEPATLGLYDCISGGVDTNETCTIASPQSGTWYVMVHAYSAYQGLSIVGSYDAPVVTQKLSVGDATVTEGNSGTRLATFTVSLDAAAAVPVVFNAATSNGTATSANDYIAANLTGLTIPAGQTSKTFTVTVKGDTAFEQNETFNVTLSGSNAPILDGTGVGTILNDDGAALSVADVSAVEGNSGTGTVTFTVKLNGAAANDVTFSIATSNGTATAGTDYVASSLTGQTIPAGQTTKTFVVTRNGDTTVEANETFNVAVTSVVNATVLDPEAVGTIINDDGPTLSIADIQLAESNSGQAKATFVVKLSQAAEVPVTYSISTANGTAVANGDYVTRSLVGETIPAGSLTRNFIINVNGDTTAEANETFTANLTAATGATILDNQATAKILNDDGLYLSIADVATTEGNSGTKTLTFTVQLSQAAAAPQYFDIATSDGTATAAGNDYVARTLTGQSIPAGMTSKVFGVSIKGDAAVEANETFKVTATNISGPATILDPQATGTITNDD